MMTTEIKQVDKVEAAISELKRISQFFKIDETVFNKYIDELGYSSFRFFSLKVPGIYTQTSFSDDVNDEIDWSIPETCHILFDTEKNIKRVAFEFTLKENHGYVSILFDSFGQYKDFTFRFTKEYDAEIKHKILVDSRHNMHTKIFEQLGNFSKFFDINNSNLSNFFREFETSNTGIFHAFNERSGDLLLTNCFYQQIKFKYKLKDKEPLTGSLNMDKCVINLDEKYNIQLISFYLKSMTDKVSFTINFDAEFNLLQYCQKSYNGFGEFIVEGKRIMTYWEEVKLSKLMYAKYSSEMKELLPELTIVGVYDFNSNGFNERLGLAEMIII